MAAFDLGRRGSVIVLTKSGADEDWGALPENVRKDCGDSRRGKYIPYAIVYDARLTAPLAFITYEDLKSGDASKIYRNALKTLKEQPVSGSGSESEAESGEQKPASEAVVEPWTSLQGSTITARALRLEGDALTLLRENGTSVTVKLSQLDEASRQRARQKFGAAP